MDEIIERLWQSGVIAILRGDDPDLIVRRGLELADIGFTSIEVTLDSEGALKAIYELKNRLPNWVLLGVGTVMEAGQLVEAGSVGASFALSPVNPDRFVETSLSLDIFPIPAAATPSEIWRAHTQGAEVVKLFPASSWTPDSMGSLQKPMRGVKLIPTGGIHPKDAVEWLNKGAFCVGLGKSLVGNLSRGTRTNPHEMTDDDWATTQRPRALALLSNLKRLRG